MGSTQAGMKTAASDSVDLLAQLESLFSAALSIALPRLGSDLRILTPETPPMGLGRVTWFHRFLDGYIRLSAGGIWPVAAALISPSFWARSFGAAVMGMTWAIWLVWLYIAVVGLPIAQQAAASTPRSPLTGLPLYVLLIYLNHGSIYRLLWAIDALLGTRRLSDRRSIGIRAYAFFGCTVSVLLGISVHVLLARYTDLQAMMSIPFTYEGIRDQWLPYSAMVALPILSGGFVMVDTLIVAMIAANRRARTQAVRAGTIDRTAMVRQLVNATIPVNQPATVGGWFPERSPAPTSAWTWKTVEPPRLRAVLDIAQFRRDSLASRAAAQRASQQVTVAVIAGVATIALSLYFSDAGLGTWLRELLAAASTAWVEMRLNAASLAYLVFGSAILGYRLVWPPAEQLEDRAFAYELIVEGCYQLLLPHEAAVSRPVHASPRYTAGPASATRPIFTQIAGFMFAGVLVILLRFAFKRLFR